MKNKEELELIEFKLNPEEGGDIGIVSIVSDPAIEQTFQLFNSIKKEYFKISSDKQEITGPVMIPNKKILRMNEAKEYYNCWFSEKTVKECSEIYLKNCNHTKANFDHEQNATDQIFVSQSWIVEDPEMDKSKALGFEDVKPGTWFMTYKVENTDLWNSIKQSDFTGFSIEGFFSMFEKIDEKEKMVYNLLASSLPENDILRLIKNIINE